MAQRHYFADTPNGLASAYPPRPRRRERLSRKYSFGEPPADRTEKVFFPETLFAQAKDAVNVTLEASGSLVQANGRWATEANRRLIQVEKKSIIIP